MTISEFLFFLYSLTGDTQKMNLFQSLTDAMDITLDSDPTAGKIIIFLGNVYYLIYTCTG